MIRAARPVALTSCWHDSCCTPYCLKKITVINLIVKEDKLQRSGTTHVLQTATKENESQVLFANVRKTLHTEDLAIVAHKVEVRKTQFQWSHLNLEAKGLKANKTKKKGFISKHDAETQIDKATYLCGICKKDVGKNSIYWKLGNLWIHQCRWNQD